MVLPLTILLMWIRISRRVGEIIFYSQWYLIILYCYRGTNENALNNEGKRSSVVFGNTRTFVEEEEECAEPLLISVIDLNAWIVGIWLIWRKIIILLFCSIYIPKLGKVTNVYIFFLNEWVSVLQWSSKGCMQKNATNKLCTQVWFTYKLSTILFQSFKEHNICGSGVSFKNGILVGVTFFLRF